MHTCPFCKSHFEYNELLFFASRQNIGGVNNQGSKPRAVPGNIPNIMDFGEGRRGFRREEPKPEAVPEVVAAPQEEDDSGFARWSRDEIYEKYRGTFWKAEINRAEERFIVRWDPEKSSHGVAKAEFWNDPVKKEYPITVRMCGDDAASVGQSAPGGLLNTAMCPGCHCAIPTEFLSVDDKNCHSIALIGYPATGKTAYKLAVIDELVRNLRQKFRLCHGVEIIADSKKFLDGEGKKFADGGAETTDANATVFPTIISIEQNDATHLITIYDLPGEAYRPQHSLMLAAHEGIRTVDAAILMVDASQLYEGARASKMEVEIRNENNEVVSAEAEIGYPDKNTDIVDPLKFVRNYHIGMNIKHMALVVTKADLLIGKFGRYFGENPTFLRQLKICQSDESLDHKNAVCLPVLQQVDKEMMRAINDVEIYAGRNIKNEICESVYGDTLRPENISAFAISTLRRPDTNDIRFVSIDDSNLVRHRVLEPMLYFMAKWGMVKTTHEMHNPQMNNQTSNAETSTDEDDGKKKKGHGLFGFLRH